MQPRAVELSSRTGRLCPQRYIYMHIDMYIHLYLIQKRRNKGQPTNSSSLIHYNTLHDSILRLDNSQTPYTLVLSTSPSSFRHHYPPNPLIIYTVILMKSLLCKSYHTKVIFSAIIELSFVESKVEKNNIPTSTIIITILFSFHFIYFIPSIN